MRRVLVFDAEVGQVRIRQRKGGRLEVSVDEKVFGRWQGEATMSQAMRHSVLGLPVGYSLSDAFLRTLPPPRISSVNADQQPSVRPADEQAGNEDFFRTLAEEVPNESGKVSGKKSGNGGPKRLREPRKEGEEDAERQ